MAIYKRGDRWPVQVARRWESCFVANASYMLIKWS
jgi:hypothetical protein